MREVHFRSAVFSPDRRYRYALWRQWGAQVSPYRITAWVLLNPSTADEERDDPTILRCIAFSRSWGDAGIVVVNIFALRSTNPRALRAAVDPVGPANDQWVRTACGGANRVLVAWGEHGWIGGRGAFVLERLLPRENVWRFGLTKTSGQPRHPLYVPATAPLELAL